MRNAASNFLNSYGRANANTRHRIAERFFNHSVTPNCEIIEEGEYLYLKTIKDINNGEELTAYYTLYNIE